jgi:hypothetical protein
VGGGRTKSKWAPRKTCAERGRNQQTTLGPLQDKRRSGDGSDEEDEEVMDTSKPVEEKTRKRKKATDETIKKKVKDNIDDSDNLDLMSDVKPILSMGLTPPVAYRFMNEIIVTNESEWAEHMYVVFACYVLFMLLCIISFRVLD